MKNLGRETSTAAFDAVHTPTYLACTLLYIPSGKYYVGTLDACHQRTVTSERKACPVQPFLPRVDGECC